MKLNKLWILFLAAVMLLAACTPANGVNAPGAPVTPTVKPSPSLPPAENQIQPPEAISKALEMLAARLDVSGKDITISSIEETQFPNTCLGLADPGEMCGEALVPGYKAMMTVGGKSYEVRTSLDGKQVRFGGDIGTGSGSAGGESPSKGTPQGQENLPVVTAARDFLKTELGKTALSAEPKLVTVESVMWPNSCLGIEKPEETCLAAITPGYRVVFEANGQQYQVNTNESGSALRMSPVVDAQTPAAGGSTGSGSTDGSSDAATQAAKALLAQQLNVKADAIQVVQVEPVEWPNGCLGVQMPGRMCTQMIVPGFRVVLENEGKEYEFHTDQAGGMVVPAIAALPETADKVLVWEQTEGTTCTHTEIGAQGVSYGPCGSTDRKQARLQQGRERELAELFVKYGMFKSETKAGSVSFNGQGTGQPGPAEMRSVAEWAKLVTMEAEGGRGGAAWGLAMAWHQEGGIAGVCSDLSIYLSGLAQPTSCSPRVQGQLDPFRMSAEDLQQLYTWVDTLASFEFEQKDSATADSMLTRLIFTGSGTQKATAAQQAEIAQFAARLYLDATR